MVSSDTILTTGDVRILITLSHVMGKVDISFGFLEYLFKVYHTKIFLLIIKYKVRKGKGNCKIRPIYFNTYYTLKGVNLTVLNNSLTEFWGQSYIAIEPPRMF